MEKLGWRDRRISPDSGSLFQTFPSARFELPENASNLEIVAFYKDILEDQLSAKCSVKPLERVEVLSR
ncbi:hypothetical protein [Pseudomonas monteilii]|uniref:hypothetical protein n=1 Tax=Pseudomonas monteilii TaxID=76759 RepID=UPI001910575D|nr:hypothetical protein [Pseudomonas monteilii]